MIYYPDVIIVFHGLYLPNQMLYISLDHATVISITLPPPRLKKAIKDLPEILDELKKYNIRNSKELVTYLSQRYRLRFGITWKFAGLFGHCYKLPLTPSFQLPSVQLSSR